MYGAALDAAERMTPYVTQRKKKGVEKKGSLKSQKTKTVIIGVSTAVQEALLLCLKSSRVEMPVLVYGETGSGKELAARRIHEAGNRAGGPFVEVNCAALTETLLESELFGHVKGAFSGADRARKGKFQAASEGTLFLDEIGDMSLSCQAKILRALQEKTCTPVGSDISTDCDARVIAATNYNLLNEVKNGNFREDLYYRLCGIEITMPPLRERTEDIYPLVMYFLNKVDAEQKRIDPSFKTPRISQEAVDLLLSYHWPGNVRQLEQAVRAAAAICEGDELQPGDFPAWLQTAMKTNPGGPVNNISGNPLSSGQPAPVDANDNANGERMRYMEALEATKYAGTGRWNLTAAARQLNIPRKTFTYRIKKMNLSQ
jgi:transcriptional regulator with PAS, ATPase and Fis domain